MADVATFAFGARSFVPAYGFGSALAGQDAGIRIDVALTPFLSSPYSNARGPWPTSTVSVGSIY